MDVEVCNSCNGYGDVEVNMGSDDHPIYEVTSCVVCRGKGFTSEDYGRWRKEEKPKIDVKELFLKAIEDLKKVGEEWKKKPLKEKQAFIEKMRQKRVSRVARIPINYSPPSQKPKPPLGI